MLMPGSAHALVESHHPVFPLVAPPFPGATLVCKDEYDVLETSLRCLRVDQGDAGPRDAEAHAYHRECVAALDGVRDALRNLNRVVVAAEVEPVDGAPPTLTAYVAAVHAWCGNVVDDLYELGTHRGRESWEARACEIGQSATSQVAESLEPLYRDFTWTGGFEKAGRPRDALRAAVERIQSEVVSLSWELGSDVSATCEMPDRSSRSR
jgi:hypothetical protein